MKALVLLSGGLDSVVALHWCLERYEAVRALSFNYGQPNRDAELTAAGVIAKRRNIPHDVLAIADAVKGLGALAPPAPGVEALSGVSRANIPARNPIFISCAAAYGVGIGWGGFAIVIGATSDDGPAFPDCRPAFIKAMGHVLECAFIGIAGVELVAPWLRQTKADVLRYAMNRRASLEDARDSVSCYLGTRCGACDPCVLRAAAFDRFKTADGTAGPPAMHGGDPHRERM